MNPTHENGPTVQHPENYDRWKKHSTRCYPTPPDTYEEGMEEPIRRVNDSEHLKYHTSRNVFPIILRTKSPVQRSEDNVQQ